VVQFVIAVCFSVNTSPIFLDVLFSIFKQISPVAVVVRFCIRCLVSSSLVKKMAELTRQFGDPIVVPRDINMYRRPGQSFSILEDPG